LHLLLGDGRVRPPQPEIERALDEHGGLIVALLVEAGEQGDLERSAILDLEHRRAVSLSNRRAKRAGSRARRGRRAEVRPSPGWAPKGRSAMAFVGGAGRGRWPSPPSEGSSRARWCGASSAG